MHTDGRSTVWRRFAAPAAIAMFAFVASCAAPSVSLPVSSPTSAGSPAAPVESLVSPLSTAQVAAAASPAETGTPALAIASAAPAPAGSTEPVAASSSDADLPVLIVGLVGGDSYGVIRPESLSSTSGGETFIDKIVWSSWTATEARADATREFLDCHPDCTHGTVSPEPMTLVLSDPVNGAFTTLVTTVLGQSQTTNARSNRPGWLGFTSAGPDSAIVPLLGGPPPAPVGYNDLDALAKVVLAAKQGSGLSAVRTICARPPNPQYPRTYACTTFFTVDPEIPYTDYVDVPPDGSTFQIHGN